MQIWLYGPLSWNKSKMDNSDKVVLYSYFLRHKLYPILKYKMIRFFLTQLKLSFNLVLSARSLIGRLPLSFDSIGWGRHLASITLKTFLRVLVANGIIYGMWNTNDIRVLLSGFQTNVDNRGCLMSHNSFDSDQTWSSGQKS